MLRKILAVIAGFIAAFVLISVFEMVGHRIWPPPADLDPTNRESIRVAMLHMPLGALLSVAVAWIVGSFGGGWLASRIARHPLPAYVVGGFVMLSSVAELMLIPHPVWFWIVALLIVPLAAFLAAKLSSPPIPQSQ